MHGASLRSRQRRYSLVADQLDGQCSAEFRGLGVQQMWASRAQMWASRAQMWAARAQMWASRAQMWASRQRRYGRLVCVYDVKDLTGLGLHARHSLDIIKV